MNTVVSVLEGFEKLAYKFLLAILFIPKTIVQITIKPDWVSGYVKGELDKKEGAFNAYLSPVLLMLVVALIPALIYDFLPPLGVTITNVPTEKDVVQYLAEGIIQENPSLGDPSLREAVESFVTNRAVKFEATTTSISSLTGMNYVHSWYVEKIVNTKGDYEEIHRENYNSKDFPVEPISNNETKDTFYYLFREAGKYYVNVDVTKFKGDSTKPVESYFSYSYIYVPDDPKDPLIIVNGTDGASGGKSNTNFSFSERLKSETTIFLALGLLAPPLIFALATKLFKKNSEISEYGLRESFYSQCYYFSPPALAIWAAFFSSYYLSSDVFFYRQINQIDIGYTVISLPLILAIIWFISVETDAIAHERQTSRWVAFLITLSGIIIILTVGTLVIIFPYIQDYLRISAIWLYLLASGALMAAFAFVWLRKKKTENSKIKVGEIVLTTWLFLCLVLNGVTVVFSKEIPPSTQIPPMAQELPINLSTIWTESSTPQAVSEAIATIAPTEANPADISLLDAPEFYTEEFDTNDNSWSYFVVDGGTSTITEEDNANMSLLRDKSMLTFDLNAMNLWVYTIYDSFEYDNVRVDARITNRGANNNNVSLICRYTEDGWYEFNVANNGLYWIYAASVDSAGKVEYGPVYDGGSDKINYGKATNEYSIICNGDTLSLFINGTEIRTITENKYSLRSGKVGISVASFDVLPVIAEVDWVSIREP